MSRSRRIQISEKHGVNPSMGVCFWCGNNDGTILLPGKLPGDAEAPHRMCATYEPCPKCAEKFSAGVHIIEAHETAQHDGHAALRGKYPTGRMVVIKREAVLRIFDPEMARAAIGCGKALMEPSCFEQLFGGPVRPEPYLDKP